jgi:hypothetical protein
MERRSFFRKILGALGLSVIVPRGYPEPMSRPVVEKLEKHWDALRLAYEEQARESVENLYKRLNSLGAGLPDPESEIKRLRSGREQLPPLNMLVTYTRGDAFNPMNWPQDLVETSVPMLSWPEHNVVLIREATFLNGRTEYCWRPENPEKLAVKTEYVEGLHMCTWYRRVGPKEWVEV